MPLKIAITDDHPMVINAMKTALELSPDISIIYTCNNATELLQQLTQHQPDILLLDIRLPDMPGTVLFRKIRDGHPGIRIIAFTSHDDPWYLKQMKELGVHGYLLKDTDFNMLENAIKTVSEGRQFVDPRIRTDAAEHTGIPFTRKEKEMLELLAGGLSIPQIAERMTAPLRLTEMHFFNLTQKLGTEDIDLLLQEARQRGLI